MTKIFYTNNILLFFIAIIVLSSSLFSNEVQKSINVLFTGQSNAYKIYPKYLDYFNAKYTQYSENNSTSKAFVSAYLGSALLRKNTMYKYPNNYWIEQNSDGNFTNGPRLDSFLKFISSMSVTPNIIVWIQGEQDATRIHSANEKTDYQNGLSFIFDQIKNEIQTINEQHVKNKQKVHFGICITGRRINVNKELGIQFVRQAQHELAVKREDVTILTETYDLELYDRVHYSYKGKKKLLRRIARSLVNYHQKNKFNIIPKIKTVTLNMKNKKELLIEIEGITKMYIGRHAAWLFSALLKETKIKAVKVYKETNSLLLLTLESAITTQHTLHIGNDKYHEPYDISTTGKYQIWNEHYLPLSSGIYSIEKGRW